ncbi:MAG: FAD:protein FMN transferase [Roseiflexaceae bacterium]|nr:FAD:protein FMN transferase [Roseiflexaceae bacterium]
MFAVVDSNAEQAAHMLAQVPQWFTDWEAYLSRFRADSELSQLNRACGAPFVASTLLLEVVDAALQAAHATEGIVTPTVLDALEAAGYVCSFERLLHRDAPALQQWGDNVVPDWRAITLDRVNRTITLPAHTRLDLGGVAKGWAADQAIRQLAAVGPALVDAGGDIAVSGPRADGSAWAVGVADPFDGTQQRELLLLTHGGVATSGRDYRRWQQNGIWQHHLLDPRTGVPSASDVISATVVAPTACEAEVAAKVALLLGSAAGLGWLEARPTLAGLVICDDRTLRRSSKLDSFCWQPREEEDHD